MCQVPPANFLPARHAVRGKFATHRTPTAGFQPPGHARPFRALASRFLILSAAATEGPTATTASDSTQGCSSRTRVRARDVRPVGVLCNRASFDQTMIKCCPVHETPWAGQRCFDSCGCRVTAPLRSFSKNRPSSWPLRWLAPTPVCPCNVGPDTPTTFQPFHSKTNENPDPYPRRWSRLCYWN